MRTNGIGSNNNGDTWWRVAWWRRRAALCVIVSLLPACVGAFEYDSYPAEVVAPPPEPMVEEVPDPPNSSSVWLPGYWYWTGARYVWNPGRYAVPPAAGHTWVRSGWIVVDGRYRFVRGYWAQPRYVPRYRYFHRAPVIIRGRSYRHYPRRH